MDKERDAVFKACYEAILYYHNHGKLPRERMDKIRSGRRALLEIMKEVIESCLKETESRSVKHLRQALQELHRDRNYDFVERLIRDAADICVTLKSIEMRRSRKSGDKVTASVMFWSYMRVR